MSKVPLYDLHDPRFKKLNPAIYKILTVPNFGENIKPQWQDGRGYQKFKKMGAKLKERNKDAA